MNPYMNLNGVCMIMRVEWIKEVFLWVEIDLNDVFGIRLKRFIVWNL